MSIAMGKFRHSTGWGKDRISKRAIQSLATEGHIDDELWVLLDYYAEVEDVGYKHLRDHGIAATKIDTIHKHFQAFVRQAKNYWNSAKTLHPRSAGLLYYYSFLNLAKAALVQHDPEIGGKKISHGLGVSQKEYSSSDDMRVDVYSSGVFLKFYEWYFNSPIGKRPLNIEKLLLYCTDVSHQCSLIGLGDSKIERGLVVHVEDAKSKTAWSYIGISNYIAFSQNNKLLDTFESEFEQVDIPLDYRREFFGFRLDKRYLNDFNFLQNKNTINWTLDSTPALQKSRVLIIDTLEKLAQTNYFQTEWSFFLCSPYQDQNEQMQMDETVAIYLIMFYVSHLVRYQPHYLEELLSSELAWVIDSFIRTCPVTFLRSIVSRIIGIDYVMGSRHGSII